MSTNLNLVANKKVYIVDFTKKSKKKKEHVLRESFPLYQTPTNITNQIMLFDNGGNNYSKILEEYEKYVKYDVFGGKDISCVNEHMTKLKQWIKSHESDGYTISFYAL